jgi:ferric-dicitrate binding protein FerR (iron transport regulator)
MTPEVRTELHRLLSGLCDGLLSEADRARLEELLAADPECRRVYLEYVDVHARLLTHPDFGGGVPPVVAEPEAAPPVPDTGRQRGGRRLLRYALVAAGTLAASLLIQLALWNPRPPKVVPAPAAESAGPPRYVATLAQVADCVWDGPAEPLRAGARLPPGELRLRAGVAKVRFDSGPVVTLEGPTVLRVESDAAAAVVSGKVVFRDDLETGGFALRTPRATLLDVGTEFAVAVDRDGEEVHVFAGEVSRLPKGPEGAGPQQLPAGVAKRYGRDPADPGRPATLDPDRFVRTVAAAGPPPADPAAGLLAYEGFDYADPGALQAGTAARGVGWAGAWLPGFARPLNPGDRNVLALDVRAGLTRPGAAVPPVGGCFDYTGFAKYFRRLAEPVRLDTDAVYYLSFLLRRHGPPADPLNAVAVLLRTTEELESDNRGGETDRRKRFNVGVDQTSTLFTFLERVGARAALPLSSGETYLLVAKVAAGSANPDQAFVRVYGPDEPVDSEEPGMWSVVGHQVESDLVFDWLQVHINSKTRQSIDEVRLGTTWSSVTAPWVRAAKAGQP